MTRNHTKDIKLFNGKKDIEIISKLYRENQDEVRHFLFVRSKAGHLQGLSNKEVYDLITEKFGYAIPQ